MSKDVTQEIDLAFFPMSLTFSRANRWESDAVQVMADRIVDATDLFPRVGRLGIGKVLLKFGETENGPVIELLEVSARRSAVSSTDVPDVSIAISSASIVTTYRINNTGLEEVGLPERVNNIGANGLLANEMLTSRVRRMGGDPASVVSTIFDFLHKTQD